MTEVRSETPSSRDLGTTIAACAAFAVVAVLPIIPNLRGMTDGYHVALAVAHAVVCGVGVGVSTARGLRPMLLIANVFPYCWLVIPSTFQIAHRVAAWGDLGVTNDFGLTLRAQGVLLLGQVALLVAYLVTLLVQPASDRAARPVPRGLPVGRMMALCQVYVGMAVLTIPLAAIAAGGVGMLFTSRGDLKESAAMSGTQDSALADVFRILPITFGVAGVILAFLLLRAQDADHRQRVIARVSIAAATLVLLIASNPFSSTRFLVLSTFGTVMMLMFRPRSRPAAAVVLAISLVACLLVYPLANFFRTRSLNPPDGYLLATPDFDGFQQVINTVAYTQQAGFAWGSQFFSGLMFFVPRGLWEGKATQASLTIAEARGYTFINLSLPLPAEAYLDLGWLGVVLFLGTVGVLWAWLDRAWIIGTPGLGLAAFLSVSQVGLWRGPFGSAFPVIGLTIGLIVVTWIIVRPRSSRSSGAATSASSARPGPRAPGTPPLPQRFPPRTRG